jgi:hypothetical protein
MSIFRPPTDPFVQSTVALDPFASQEQRLANALFGHFANGDRGRNVYKLNDGTYTEDQPGDMTTVAITYYGGHDIQITDDEAASLTAAGYGAYIS